MPASSHTASAFVRRTQLRAQRRKSLWNILLLPLGFGAWVAVWYGLFRLAWLFHCALYPEHRLAKFWPRGIGTGAFAASFAMVFALAPAAMVLGFMLANIVVRTIPWARRKLDAEAQPYPGTSFASSMRDLGKIAVWALPIGLATSAAAAYLLSSLR